MSMPISTANVLQFQPKPAPNVSRAEEFRAWRPTGSIWDFGRLFESMWKNSLDAMRITNEDGTIVAVNDAFCKLFGMDVRALEGRPYTTVYDQSRDTSVMIEGYRKRFRLRHVEPLMQREIVLHSGKKIHVETTNAYVNTGEGQTLLLSIFRDITARVHATEMLWSSERKYHELFEHAVQGIFQSTADGLLLNANPALLNMLGYSSIEELQQVDLDTLYTNPDERVMLAEVLRQDGYCHGIELCLRKKDGTPITVVEHSRAVKDDDGNVLSYEGIIEDVTARKALETRLHEHVSALKSSQRKLEEINGQKDKLMSVLSHDLRSPFSSILGFCEILLNEGEELSSAERKEFLTYIKESAEQQLALVNRLLDWSRLETGRIKLNIKEVDLRDVVRTSVNSLLGIAKQKNVTMYSNVSPGATIRGDEQLLSQVFNNLLGNALKFTPANGVIAVELAGEKDGMSVLRVSDTGTGIPQEDLTKLFKIEEKYSRPGLAGEQGTGLGLSVVHEIVQKHSGTITVESEVGKGTTFVLAFPTFSSDLKQQILVVDDEQGVRALHSRYIKKTMPDASIIQASNGGEAFEFARKYRPQIIITDYGMPGLDGFEFLNKLKNEESTKNIPVYVVSGKDSLASREALILVGAVDVLAKPIGMEQFEKILKSAFDVGTPPSGSGSL